MTGRNSTLLAATVVFLGLTAATPSLRAQDLTVVWADDSNSDVTYDPRVTQSRHEEQIIVQVFDQLIAADENGKLYPGLAASWTVAPDNKSVTLKLREDVKFHDGTPFSAEAVKFTFDTIADPKTGSQGAVDMLGPYEGTDLNGPYEVRVRYKRPFADALFLCRERTLTRQSDRSPEARQYGLCAGAGRHGTLQIRFWEKGREVILERNPDYRWAPAFSTNKGPSKVAKIVHCFIPNAATRVAALEAGEVQVSDITPPLDTKRLADSGVSRQPSVSPRACPMGFCLTRRGGHSLTRRSGKPSLFRSIGRSCHRTSSLDLAKPAWGPLAPSSPLYWSGVEKFYAFSRDRANKLLDEGGWKMGSGGIREKDGKASASMHRVFLSPIPA